MGIPNPAIRYFSAVPWLARAMVDLRPEYGLLVHLDADVADLVALAVSQENSCRFCYAAVRMLLWALGMSWARIQRLATPLDRVPPAPYGGLVTAFAGSPIAPARRCSDDLERLTVPFARETIWYEPDQLQRRARVLRDRLSPPQFLEAIGVASLANGLCRMGAMVLQHA
jgi:AhpD family alkylhydroperoxidase